jgi:hypothetical protein
MLVDQCAFGTFESGEMNEGYRIYRYRTKMEIIPRAPFWTAKSVIILCDKLKDDRNGTSNRRNKIGFFFKVH